MERLSYSEFKKEFLFRLAILTEGDMSKEASSADIAAMIKGKFPQSWIENAERDLRYERRIDEITHMGDLNLRITGFGLEIAEEYASEIGTDVYDEIEEYSVTHTRRMEEIERSGWTPTFDLPALHEEIKSTDQMSEPFRALDEQLKESVRSVRSDNTLMADAEGSQRIAELEAGRAVIQAKQVDTSLVKRLLLPGLSWAAKKVRDETASTIIKATIAALVAWLSTLS